MTRSKQNSHIVVVGAGIIGASIAFNLTAREANVTLLDAAEPGQGASGVSFAWLNSLNKKPRHYHDLNRRSIDIWDRFARRLGGDVGLTWGGELNWATTESGANAILRRTRQLLSWGYPVRLLDAAEVKEMEPGLVPGPVICASLSELDGQVETGTLIRAALEKSVEQGLVLKTQARLTGIHLETGPDGKKWITGVQTDFGDLACDVLVLASGSDSPELAALAGIHLPLSHTFGASILTEPTARIFQNVAAVNTAPDLPLQISLRQWPDGSVMIHGGVGNGTASYGETEAEIQEIVETAVGFMPALDGVPIREIRRGRRPVPADGLPILGFTEAVPNLYLAAMHSGVTLAALVGSFAPIEILDQTRIDLLKPYRLERFLQEG